MTIYDFLHCKKGAKYKQEVINEHTQSWLYRKPQIDKPAGALAGNSRVVGDASADVQAKIIDLIVEIGTRYKFPYRDIAHSLLLCSVESGFNPDAAAGTTSAGGLGQYTNDTADGVLNLSQKRLNFVLDIRGERVFDAELGAFGIILSYMICKEKAIEYFSTDYERHLYLFHNRGWNFKPTDAHMQKKGPQDAMAIIRTKILPKLDALEKMLSEKNSVSLKLVTKDEKPYSNQPYVAIYPSKSSPGDHPPLVQGADTKDVKWTVGKTDGQGKTAPVNAPALSEVVFVVLNKDYKDFLSASSSSGETSQTVKKGDTLSKIAAENGTTVDALQKINHIANPNQIAVGQTIVTHQGDYVCRKPEIDDIAPFLQSALSATSNSAPAMVEHAGSHILLPEGNKAQTHEGEEKVVVLKGGKTADQVASQKKLEDVPHKTVEQNVKKVVEIPPVVAEKPLLQSCKADGVCIKKGSPNSLLIQEINIRLAGFGGALPTDEFTDLTEKCVKQFQRDFMKVAETGRVCGNVLKAIDDFMSSTNLARFFPQMKCQCKGKCSGFGKGRKFGIEHEYPGIHRSLLWAFRAVQFYLKKTDSEYSICGVSSGYRCIDRMKQMSTTTTNHLGRALDVQFLKKGEKTRTGLAGINQIRSDIFIKYIGAQYDWHPNKFGMERDLMWSSKLQKMVKGADTWVHFDLREFDRAKYQSDSFFVESVDAADGGSIVEMAKRQIGARLALCSGQA